MGEKASSPACQATGQHTLRKGVPQVRAAKDLFNMCPLLFSGVRQDCVAVFQVGTHQGTDGSTRNVSRGEGTGVRRSHSQPVLQFQFRPMIRNLCVPAAPAVLALASIGYGQSDPMASTGAHIISYYRR